MKELCKFLGVKKILTAIFISIVFMACTLLEVFISYIIKNSVDINNESWINDFMGYVPYLLIITCVYGIFKLVSAKTSVSYAGKIIRNSKLKYARLIQDSRLMDIRDHETGELYTYVHENIASSEETFKLLPSAIAAPFILCFTLIIFFVFNWKVTLVCLITIPVPTLLFNVVNKPIQKKTSENIANVGKANETLKSTIRGLDVIKTNRVIECFTGKYNGQLDTIRAKDLEIERAKAKTVPFNFFLRAFPQFLIPIYISYLAFKGECSIGLLPAFGLLVANVFNPIDVMLRFSMKLRETKAYILNLKKLDSLEPERVGGTVPGFACLSDGRREPIVSFRNVGFKYKDKKVLEDVSFDIEANNFVAIVGESGSGKSTIIKLLEGLFDGYEGSIKVFGEDLRDIDHKKMREKIAVMSQNAFLLSDSVRDNLLYGVSGYSDDSIKRAVERANLSEVIDKLPEGEDTVLTERGMNLSGGQRQRVALARTILKDAPIIILDEATSGLEPSSVSCIMDTIRELKKDHTIIMITHDIQMASESDKIILLKDHSVGSVGDHRTLLEDDYYNSLYNMQQSIG